MKKTVKKDDGQKPGIPKRYTGKKALFFKIGGEKRPRLVLAVIISRSKDSIVIRPVGEMYDVTYKRETIEQHHMLPPTTQKTINRFKKT